MAYESRDDPALVRKMKELAEGGLSPRALMIHPFEIAEAVHSARPELPKEMIAIAVGFAVEYITSSFESQADRSKGKPPAIRAIQSCANLINAHFLLLVARVNEPRNEELARTIAEHTFALSFTSQPASEKL